MTRGEELPGTGGGKTGGGETGAVERLGFIPAFDGVRAIAVLAVMASHAHPTLLRGGALGVDIFFALSGFLITTLILDELRTHADRYRFGAFYLRRCLRLFPALYAMLAAVALYLWWRWPEIPAFLARSGPTPAGYPRAYISHLIAAGTYTTNLAGYQLSPTPLVAHTWSLAVEEQYYLFWPVIVVAAVRGRRSASLRWALGAFVALCLVGRLAGVTWAEGFLWCRPEAIALGSLAALLRIESSAFRRLCRRAAPRAVPALAVVLAGAVLAFGHGVAPAVYTRGGYTLIAVAAAAWVVTMASSGATPVERAFSARPLVWVGAMSYGLYLWHMPVFRVLSWEFPDLSAPALTLLRFLGSFVIATCSLYWWERPFRRMQSRFRPGGAVAV